MARRPARTSRGRSRGEGETIYWDVETQRERREFVLRANCETVLWLDEHRLLMIDVDGNRFEIPDLRRLDRASLAILDQVL